MGILELILGIILVFLIADLFLSLIPLPRGIIGTIIAILVIYFVWRFIF